MAKLARPILFSQHFGVPPSALNKAGLLDPIVNSDTKLFIDPLLIGKSRNPVIKARGIKLMREGLKNVLELVEVSEEEDDVAWKAAYKALNLDERPETGLGFGGASRSGSSRPKQLRNSILRTAKQIVTLGVKNPNVIPLMGLFEKGVGPDTLSDMSTNLMLPLICELTEDFATSQSLPTRQFGAKYSNRWLPVNPTRPNEPILLVPKDIIRDLPLAVDWPDVSRVIMEVREIRDAVNAMFGNWSKATVAERKEAVRRAALSDVEILRKILAVLADASESYDEKRDLDGHFAFRKLLHENSERYKGLVTKPDKYDQDSLRDIVISIIARFRDMVENNNLWELLWHGDQPRHERAAQLLFFAVANVICAANDLDVSPETNSGGGPVDFKFSRGFRGRVLVEIKLSKGQVVDGYTKQLETYKRASKNASGIFLVIDVGGIGTKLRRIRAAKAQAEKSGLTSSDIEYVDARRQRSASKR